ncbi:MAG: Fe2+-dependent dioxygenase [Rubrivivax sp.]
MLLRIPQLLAPEALNEAQALLERGAWVDGRVTAGPQAATAKNNLQLRADSDETHRLQALVLRALDTSALFFSAALPKRVLPPQFNRYGGSSNFYGSHVDQAVRYHPQTRQAIRTDLSCTVFFAAPDSYDGGELVVQDTFGEQRLKLAAGDAVLYPGTSVHRVEPVTRGTRLASFFWIESMVRSDEHRRLLFDMDMALMRLRQRDGESEEAVALTGTYHNLLRQWADT